LWSGTGSPSDHFCRRRRRAGPLALPIATFQFESELYFQELGNRTPENGALNKDPLGRKRPSPLSAGHATKLRRILSETRFSCHPEISGILFAAQGRDQRGAICLSPDQNESLRVDFSASLAAARSVEMTFEPNLRPVPNPCLLRDRERIKRAKMSKVQSQALSIGFCAGIGCVGQAFLPVVFLLLNSV
jgi:hypothetical protein